MEKKTFVLIPGAWTGAWVWRSVAPLLRKEGHSAYPITLTGMGDRVHLANPQVGIETAIQDVVNSVNFQELENLVVVGHSFAGKVAAGVADRVPDRVGTVLFLDSFRPSKVRGAPQGGSDDWSAKDWEDVMRECREKGEGWKYLLTDAIMNSIGADIVGKEKEWFLSKTTPFPVKMFGDPITLTERFDSLRKAYILCTKGGDNVAEIEKEGLDGEHRVIDSGHWPMVTKPAETAKAMLELS